MGGYRELFSASINDPETFWAEAAQAVSWLRPPQRVFDDSHPPFYRWFPDATLNTCANALDRHVAAGRAEQAALIYDSPVTGVKRTYTYGELLDQTARFAGALRDLGVGKGDRVVLYMPMIPEAVIAMLACARLGAVHSVVFGGFAAHELATRIDDARPTVVVSASCGIEPSGPVQYKPMLDAALESAQHKPRSCVVVQRDQHRCALTAGRDVDWHELMANSAARRRRAGGGHRPAVRALHLRHDRQAEGHRARQRRARGGAAVEHAAHLRHPSRRRVLGGIGCGLGGRALLHRVRAAATRSDDGALRRQARQHPGSGCVLAGGSRTSGQGAVHRAHRDPRDPQRRPGRRIHEQVRPLRAALSVPGRRTPRPRHLRVGLRQARHPGHRPLVADRNRLGHRRQSDGRRTVFDQAGLTDAADAGLRRVRPSRRRISVRRRGKRARSASACRCHRAHCPRCGATTPASRPLICASIPAITSPETAVTSTRTAICTCWAASTT